MKPFLTNLNPAQYEAATTLDGPVLIIAGAGSGKTFVLISRVANMIDEGISPEEILLLTFTNKAANEMKERIGKYIGLPAEKVTACTFHSFCANFLRKHCHLINMPNNFNVLDSVDSLDAISIAMQEFFDNSIEKYDFKDFPNKKKIASVYTTAVNNCTSFADVIADYGLFQYSMEIQTIIQNYIDYKAEHVLFDYDDLLLHTKTILENFESVRSRLDAKYKYISTDEYQDTNILQDEILALLSRDYRNLAVVGDDDQSIYKFRCANIENILTFEKRYPGCKKIILTENYRSSQEILDLSNAVMKYKKEGTSKNLHGQFHNVDPRLIITNSTDEEVDFIVRNVLKQHRQGVLLKDIAVIARSSSQSYKLEAELNRCGIPFEKFGGLKFLEKAVVKDILAFLRLSVNEKDELAMYRVLQLYPGIGVKTAKKIAEGVSQNGINALHTLYPKNKFHPYLEELFDVIEELKNRSVTEQLEALINEYYAKTALNTLNLSNKKETTKLEEKQTILEQVEESKVLIQMASKYKTTSKFLEDLTLEASMPQNTDDYLNITTVHSAKGLEYDTVFILDVIEGVTPKTQENQEDDKEELRCFYVAITRAKNNLYLLVPKMYAQGGYFTEQSVLSHFINRDDILRYLNSNVSDYELNTLRYKKEAYNYGNNRRNNYGGFYW